jgi:hypothetical protein
MDGLLDYLIPNNPLINNLLLAFYTYFAFN